MSIQEQSIEALPNLSKIDLAKNIGFCALKPDYRDISGDFSDDLGRNGLEVVHSADVQLNKGLIDYIYSDSHGEDFYPHMRDMLASRAIHAILVAKQPGASEDMPAQGVLESLKRGTKGYPNLRAKYHRNEHVVSDSDFEDWQHKKHPHPDQMTLKITQQNVFHASDGPHDAIGTLLRMRESTHPEINGFFNEMYTPASREIMRGLDIIRLRHYRERDMTDIKREWRVIDEMPVSSETDPIRQVYVWMLTEDNHVVIVSKDNVNWQLPGGKPDGEETAVETAVREAYEETGVDISEYNEDVTFFGEYSIKGDTDSNLEQYRQVRSWLKLPLLSSELMLTTAGESTTQRSEDAVRFVKAIPVENVVDYIEWLPRADEYKALKRTKVISV